MNKITVLFIFALTFCFLFSSCSFKKRQPLPDINQTFEQETFANETDLDSKDKNLKDKWKDNYLLKYDYIHQGSSSIIYEIKGGNNFLIVDEESGLSVYYTQGENDNVDYYTLDTNAKKGSHLSQEDSQIKDLRSPFMNLSFVSPDFKSFDNVVFEEDEEICGRAAKRYRQTAVNEEGEITDYLLVWIDNEYDFAIKCTICKADSTIIKAWEVLEFKVGGINDEQAKIDLTDYSIDEK